MDLWIRSQDKTNLIKVEHLAILNGSTITGMSSNWDYDLGKYSSKERALEVLDEIQKIFDFRIENKNYQEADLFVKAKMFPKIYQMPKD